MNFKTPQWGVLKEGKPCKRGLPLFGIGTCFLQGYPCRVKFLSLISLARLIGDSAGGFASGLAGGLALSAAALCSRFLKISLIYCFNVLHGVFFLSQFCYAAREYSAALFLIITYVSFFCKRGGRYIFTLFMGREKENSGEAADCPFQQ